MGQQGFGIELWVDDDYGVGCARSVHDGDVRLQVIVEGAFGDFVVFLNRALRRGMPDQCPTDWM
jgi:hypothetical protein